jgi:hypothetical protein
LVISRYHEPFFEYLVRLKAAWMLFLAPFQSAANPAMNPAANSLVPPPNNMGGPYPPPPLFFSHGEKSSEKDIKKATISGGSFYPG